MATTHKIPAGELVVNAYPLTRKLRFDRIGVYIDVGGPPGSLIRLGFYDSDGQAYPQNLLVDSGDLDGTVGGVTVSTPIDLTLDKGLYFIAANSNIIGLTIYYTVNCLPTFWGDEAYGPYATLTIGQPYGPMPNPFPLGAGSPKGEINSFSLRLAEVL